MTGEEKQKAINALKISAPIMAVTQEEFKDYIQTLNKIMDWLEQEPKTGHWINGDEKCPYCGKSKFEGLDADIYADWRPKYCPNCGKKMEEVEE